jgi:hypothetical protein
MSPAAGRSRSTGLQDAMAASAGPRDTRRLKRLGYRRLEVALFVGAIGSSGSRPPTYPYHLPLVSAGSFAVGTGAKQVVVERCGTKLRRVIVPDEPDGQGVAENAHAILWQSSSENGHSSITGLFLPSLRTFRLTYPPATGDLEFAMSLRNLYVADLDGEVWSTSAPRQ